MKRNDYDAQLFASEVLLAGALFNMAFLLGCGKPPVGTKDMQQYSVGQTVKIKPDGRIGVISDICSKNYYSVRVVSSDPSGYSELLLWAPEFELVEEEKREQEDKEGG